MEGKKSAEGEESRQLGGKGSEDWDVIVKTISNSCYENYTVDI